MAGESAGGEPADPGDESRGSADEPRPPASTGPSLPPLDRLSRVAASALDVPAACVWLLQPGDLALVGGAEGAGDLGRERFLVVARSLGQSLLETGDAVFFGDLSRRTDQDASAAAGTGVVSFAGVPVRSPDGGVIGAVCVGDVRRRRWTPGQRDLLAELAALAATEARLRVAEREAPSIQARLDQYEQAVTQASEVVWSMRILPGRRAEFVYISPNVAQIVDPALLVGPQDVDELSGLAAPDDVQILAEFLALMVEGEPAQIELRVVDPEGRVRWLYSRCQPRRAGGELFADGVTSEITERKQVEEMRTQFLAIAGHELRTPLSVIRGYAEVVASQVVDQSVVHRQVAAMERRAAEMDRLLSDFFDLAKLGSNEFELALSPVRVDALAQEAVTDHALAAADGEVELRLTTDAAVTLQADPARVRQVLDNLLSNAVRHTPEGGEVRVTCGRQDGAVRLGIENDGPEVAEEDVPRLFERFYRGRSRGDDDGAGTGLGLAVVKAIAQAHGGDVSAHRLPGRGMRFEVLLPLGEAEQEPLRS